MTYRALLHDCSLSESRLKRLKALYPSMIQSAAEKSAGKQHLITVYERWTGVINQSSDLVD